MADHSTVSYQNMTQPSPDTSRILAEDIQKALIIYILPIIIFVGTAGNALAFAVLSRSRMRRTSVYFYLTVLACADTAVLFVSGFKTWIRQVTDFEFLHLSDSACRTTMFVLVFAQHFSAWLLVLVTGDRFVAVWFPFRASVLCSARRARLAVSILALVIILYNIHLFWTMHLKLPVAGDQTKSPFNNNSKYIISTKSLENYEEFTTNFPALNNEISEYMEQMTTTARPLVYIPPKCGGRSDLKFMKEPFEYLKLTTYSLLPFMIILIINILIVVKLRWRAPVIRRHVTTGYSMQSKLTKNFEKYGLTKTERDTDVNLLRYSRSPEGRPYRPYSAQTERSPVAEQSTLGRQARVTYMLLTVSISYLLLTGPYSLNLILSYPASNSLDKARQLLLRTVFFLIMHLNHAVNFFLYCLTGRKFRHELRDMFKGVAASCRQIRHPGRHSLPSPSLKTLRTHINEAELQDMTSPHDDVTSSADDAKI